jgi:hypothetical protein
MKSYLSSNHVAIIFILHFGIVLYFNTSLRHALNILRIFKHLIEDRVILSLIRFCTVLFFLHYFISTSVCFPLWLYIFIISPHSVRTLFFQLHFSMFIFLHYSMFTHISFLLRFSIFLTFQRCSMIMFIHIFPQFSMFLIFLLLPVSTSVLVFLKFIYAFL